MSARPASDTQRLRRLNTLLEAALALPEDERDAWLQALPAEHQPLAPVLSAMLRRVSVETDNFMRQRPGLSAAAGNDFEAAVDAPGERVGPYRLIRELGRGGMASVWLAERADGALQRQVALKLPHVGWGPGLAQRMARERDILAALEHPHIARLYDAGMTDEARPYLAMEYVDGQTIDRHCREQGLAVEQRLRLFLQVADALAHAHARLVIHRDLKPSNILVTPEGEVRLLDFGVAKLLEGETTRDTQLTRVGGRAFTPDYASPEQIRGEPLTVASDVYSLAAVLYELLSGQRPYKLKRDSAAALEEAILAADVPPASARVAGDRRLARQLRGDLDTVLAKALSKRVADRYASVESFATDIRRHLGGQPVLARAPSARYRLAKFVQRNRLQVGAAAAVGLAIVAGAGVSVWQARLAKQQAASAQRQAERAQAVQAMLLSIFKANSDQQPDPVRARQTTARELLDIGAAQAAQSLGHSPEAHAEVLGTLSDMYVQLGLAEEGARTREQLVAALKKAYGDADARVADALLAYADDVSRTAQPVRALAAIDEARRILDAAGDRTSPARGWVAIMSADFHKSRSIAVARREADIALNHFRAHPGRWTDLFHALQAAARTRYFADDFDAAAAGHREALMHAERHTNGPSAWSITPLVHLAEAQFGELKIEEAEKNLRAALALSKRLNGDLSGVTLQTQAKVGGLLHATGRLAEGMRLLEEALATVQRKDANATPNAVNTINRLMGAALLEEGRLAQAEPFLAREVADLQREQPDSLLVSRALLAHAGALAALGREEAAGRALNDAWRMWQQAADGAAAPQAANRYALAQARGLLARGDLAAAEVRLAAVVPYRAPPPALHPDEIQAKLLLAQLRTLQQRPAEAVRLAQEAFDGVRASPLRTHFARLEAEAALALGQARLAQGDATQARADLEHAHALREATDAPTSPWLAQAKTALADCAIDLGDRRLARRLVEQARTIVAAQRELAPSLTASLARVTNRLDRRS